MNFRSTPGLAVILFATVSSTTFAADKHAFPQEMMISATVQHAIQSGNINKMRIPSGPVEQSDADAACKKGPPDFYEWIAPGTSQGVPKRWDEIGVSDPLGYCHALFAALQDAKKNVKGSAGSATSDRSLIAQEKQEAKMIFDLAKSHGEAITQKNNYPKTDAEYAKMNAAAKTGLAGCLDYLFPGEDHSDYKGQPYSVMGVQDGPLGCNKLGLQFLDKGASK